MQYDGSCNVLSDNKGRIGTENGPVDQSELQIGFIGSVGGKVWIY